MFQPMSVHIIKQRKAINIVWGKDCIINASRNQYSLILDAFKMVEQCGSTQEKHIFMDTFTKFDGCIYGGALFTFVRISQTFWTARLHHEYQREHLHCILSSSLTMSLEMMKMRLDNLHRSSIPKVQEYYKGNKLHWLLLCY